MINYITSSIGFLLLLSFFAIGAVGSLLFQKNDRLSNLWGNLFAIAGSIGGIIFSSLALCFSRTISFSFNSMFSLMSVSVKIDKLSAFFLFIISLIALFCSIYAIGYVKHFYKKYNIGVLGFFYNLFIIGMLLVVTASNGLFFLVAWEIMSIASYFLVIYDRNDEKNIKSGFLYLIMTHIGTAFIFLAFILLYKFTGSFNFDAIKAGAVSIPWSIKNAVFLLSVVGFGTKAGIIPLHIWLPSAHPAAPSHVSGLMSGVMIKTGIFMMIRIFLDMLQPIPLWWGIMILIIGAISSILGVLYALTEHDIKRLLAYHSIENIGIILLGLGSALVFSSLGMPSLCLISLVAALFHTLNHSIFKSLLFLSAGSVINETHTRNMEEYGGLIKYMPQTALFFLVGSMAISALPPFNGFFSEWLTFQSLFQGIATSGFSVKWIFILTAGALAFTGGLALACFVKAFGATFLARPRSSEVEHAKESSPSLLIGMGSLAALCLLFGIFSGPIVSLLNKIGQDLNMSSYTNSFVSVSHNQSVINAGNFSSISGPIIFIFLFLTFIIVFLTTKYFINRKQKIVAGITWDCGTDMTPRMEITATGFSRSIITVFKGILKPSMQNDIRYEEDESGYLVKTQEVNLSVKDIYQTYFYTPISNFVAYLSERVKRIQGGNINVYILYIFITLLVALLLM